MKRTAIAVALVATLTSAGFAFDRYTPSAGSLIRIEGTSTLHEWSMEGTTINGEVSVTDPATKAAKVVVAIPVATIRSEHDKMDKLMAEALKSKANPEIRYELLRSTVAAGAGENFTLKTVGRLTIASVTREVAMDVAGTREADGRYVLTGHAPIRMTDFGIDPPKAMFNTIRTGNDIKVTFRWVVAAKN